MLEQNFQKKILEKKWKKICTQEMLPFNEIGKKIALIFFYSWLSWPK